MSQPMIVVAGAPGEPSLVCEDQARRALIVTCLQMGALGLNTGRAGNVSLRWHRGGAQGAGMLITPAATPYDTMQIDDIVWMPIAATAPPAQRSPSGRRPSSEWQMHGDIYRARAEAGAIVHVHSPAATALACLPRIQAEGIPAFHYMVAVAGGADIRCAPYRTFGSAELSTVALQALEDRRACLLAHHGTIAFGATLGTALELSAELESLAGMYAQALQIGEPAVLGDDEIAAVLARFAAYRGG